MLFQTHHKLIATPDGIFLDDVPLHRCALNTFSRRSLRHFLRATELHAKMTPEDWELPSQKLAEIQIELALTNPGTLNKYPGQPRNCLGQFACDDNATDQHAAHDDTPEKRQQVADNASKWIGTPYAKGGTHYAGASAAIGIGGDCSGTVNAIYNISGAGYPYTETAQFAQAAASGKIPFRKLEPDETPQPGDVVLYPGHMSIYAGNDAVYSAHRNGFPFGKFTPVEYFGDDFVYYRHQVQSPIGQ